MSWAFTQEKIGFRIDELREAAVMERRPVEPIRLWKGELPLAAAAPGYDDAAWTVLGPGRDWGREREMTAWLRARVEAPAEWAGSAVVLHVHPHDCEILGFVDGEPRQAFDSQHHDLWLADRLDDARSWSVAMEAYSGIYAEGTDPSVTAARTEEHRLSAAEVRRIDCPTLDLYHDMRFAHQTALAGDSSHRAHGLVIQALDEAVNMLDFRRGPRDGAFYESVRRASEWLRTRLHDGLRRDELAPVLWAVGHAHIDTAWLWRLSHTRRKCARTFTTALELMRRYPDYRFTCSQPPQYEYVREDHPALYERIRQAARAGRWEGVGGMWVEADCNVSSGEALVRQFLYGRRFFERELGVPPGEVVWLPDVFGYSAAFPQIARKSGMKYFMTIKIFWNQVNKPPYQTFRWHGIDGSDVLVHFSPNGTYNASMEPAQMKETWDRYAQKAVSDSVLYVYGWGDGGGGPTQEMLETARRAADFGMGPRVKLSTAQAFFEHLDAQASEAPRLPTWRGELYLEYHRGTYTSQSRNKRNNRKSEIMLQTAEQIAARALVEAGRAYPHGALDEAWKLVLLNQFHDILPGSSIKEVYTDCERDYARVRELGETVISDSLAAIAAPGPVAYNPLPWTRVDVVEVPREWGVAGQDAVAMDGSEVTVVSLRGVPACGWVPIAVEPGESDLEVDERTLSNRFYRIALDDHLEIVSLFDKRHGHEVMAGPGNALLTFEDKPMYWDAWDIDVFYQDKVYPWDDVAEARVIERGPLRAGIEVSRVLSGGRGSVLRQRIYVYRDDPRIDFVTRVDWREKQTLLKVAFPVRVNALRATYDIQFGSVERPTHWNTSWDWARFEVCGHKWADLSEGGYGVSLLSDCKYGWDIRDNVMRLTLLKSAVSPDPTADEGVHDFTYSLLPHAGDWRQVTIRHAYELNVPAVVGRGGELGRDGSCFVRVEGADNLVLETVKKAEDDDAVVVRLYESHNQRGEAVLRFKHPIRSAESVNLMEDEPDAGPVVVEGDGLRFSYLPFELRTFKVFLQHASEGRPPG